MEKKIKISSTAYRVLLLLHKLNEGECCVDELNKVFSQDINISRLFSKDVILKYISTLRLAGYEISKPTATNKYCYKLNKAPIKIEFSEENIRILALLGKYAQSLHQIKLLKNYNLILEKLKRYMNEEQKELLKREIAGFQENKETIFNRFDKNADLIKKIEKYLEDKQRVEIKYLLPVDSVEKHISLELQALKYDKDFISISAYNFISGQPVLIKLDYIKDIKQLPSLARATQTLCPVIFKLKGRLAKNYRPYEGEKLTKTDERTKELTVTSYTDDMDTLLKRLLRYGENCEVLYPKQARNQMINLIRNTIKVYSSTP